MGDIQDASADGPLDCEQKPVPENVKVTYEYTRALFKKIIDANTALKGVYANPDNYCINMVVTNRLMQTLVIPVRSIFLLEYFRYMKMMLTTLQYWLTN